MRLAKIHIFRLRIPFRMPVSHHLAQRSESEAIIAMAEDDGGRKGFGEGTPRQFVTGETVSSCLKAAEILAGRLVQEVPQTSAALLDLLRRVGDLDTARANPAAWCALELAILDLWARRARLPLWRLLGKKASAERFTYSAILPLLPEPTTVELLQLIAGLRLQFVKIKVADRQEGIARVKLARRMLGPAINLRVDANGAFSGAAACGFLAEAQPLGLSAIEQPVPKEDLAGLQAVSACRVGVAVIADESCCTAADAETLADKGACQGINIRLAKCGGILKSLDLFGRARAAGLFCQIGCHVGETAILSAAGRHLAALCPDHRFLEGSLSRFVLTEDLTLEDITFGERGEAPMLKGPGFGVSIDENRLARWGELAVQVLAPAGSG